MTPSAEAADDDEGGGTTQFSKSCRQIYGNLAENQKSARGPSAAGAAGDLRADQQGTGSPIQSLRVLGLGKDAAGNLEWNFSERIVRWIMAGRDIQDECLNLFPSDVVNWKLKVTGMLLYGAAQMLVAIIAAVIYSFSSRLTPIVLLLCHTVAVLTSFLVLTVVNQFRLLSQTSGVAACSAVLVFLCTVGPSLHFFFGSSEDTCGALIWNLGGPAGALFLLPHPIQSLTAVMVLRIVLDIVVLSTRQTIKSTEDLEQQHPLISFLVITISHVLCPLAITLMFQRASAENKWRSQALAVSRRELAAKQANSRWLIYCLIPEQRALKLPSSAPEKWHTGGFDLYSDCSIIQMDVSGFTALSAKIGSEELVDLINALFTSIDFAAECIGKVWKVELIGDCYKAVVGGVFPCDDHAYRAAVFAHTIVEIVKRISDRLAVALRVRVGVHSGAVTAGVVGELMPRYLIFGRDTEVVNKLECSADPGQVLLSEAAAQRLQGWPHLFAKVVTLCDGTEVRAHAIESPQINQKAMGKARSRFTRLARFHRSFCRSRYNLRLISDNIPKPDEEEEGGGEAVVPAVESAREVRSDAAMSSRRGSLTEEIGYISKVATELENKRQRMVHQKSQGSLKQLTRHNSTVADAKSEPVSPGLGLRSASSERRLLELVKRGSERVLLVKVNAPAGQRDDNQPMFLTDSAPSSAQTDPTPLSGSGKWFAHSTPAIGDDTVRPVLRKAKTEGRLLVRKGMFSLSSEDLMRPATVPTHSQSLRLTKTQSLELSDRARALRGDSQRDRAKDDDSLRPNRTIHGKSFGTADQSDDDGTPPPPDYPLPSPPPPDTLNSPTAAHNPPLFKPAPARSSAESQAGPEAARRRSGIQLRALPPIVGAPAAQAGGHGQQRPMEEGGGRKKVLRELRPLGSAGAAAPTAEAAYQDDLSLYQVNPPVAERCERDALAMPRKLEVSSADTAPLPGQVESDHAPDAVGDAVTSPGVAGPAVHEMVGRDQEAKTHELPRPPSLPPAAQPASDVIEPAPVARADAMHSQQRGKPAWRSMKNLEEGSVTRHVRIKSVAEEQEAGMHDRAQRTTMRIAEDTKRLAHKKEKHRPRRNSVQSTTETTATGTSDSPPNRLGAAGTRATSWFLPSSQEALKLHKLRSEPISPGVTSARGNQADLDDDLPSINDSWLGTNSHSTSDKDVEDDDSSDSDAEEEEAAMTTPDRSPIRAPQRSPIRTPVRSSKEGQLKETEDDEGDDVDDDDEAARRLARITSLFILGICSGAAIQTAVMLFVFFQEPRGRQPEYYDLAPAVLYVAVLGTMLCAMVLRVDWSAKYPQLIAGVLLLAAPAALLGGLHPTEHVQTAVLWSFLAVLLRSTSTALATRNWVLWFLVYLAVVAAVNAWDLAAWSEAEGDGVAEEPQWWRELLLGLNHVLPSSLFMLPLALTARDLLADENKAVKYLLEVQQQERLESLLLMALVPTAVSERFLMADRLIADKYQATVLFIYVCDYEEVMLRYGADMTIAWMNQIFTGLDGCINDCPKDSVTKVETFNNFLLAFSGVLETADEPADEALDRQHAERCMALAVQMLQATAHVRRPDGKVTTVKVGLSSGAICAGVICGLASPRYSIFGDTVNTASRMASNALPSTAASPYIHCSATTRDSLDDDFCRELQASEGLFVAPRGEGIEIKGKGKMQTYCVTQHREPQDEWWRAGSTG